MRTPALPEAVRRWSPTGVKETPIRIVAGIVTHGRCVTFRLAEGAVPRGLFAEILRLIAELRPQPALASPFSMSLDPHDDGPGLQISARGGQYQLDDGRHPVNAGSMSSRNCRLMVKLRPASATSVAPSRLMRSRSAPKSCATWAALDGTPMVSTARASGTLVGRGKNRAATQAMADKQFGRAIMRARVQPVDQGDKLIQHLTGRSGDHALIDHLGNAEFFMKFRRAE